MPDAQMDEFLRQHMGLARKAAWDFSQRYGTDYSDAFSDAQYMLWLAAKTWHATGGASFASWYLRWARIGLYKRRFSKKSPIMVSLDELVDTTHFDAVDNQPYMRIDLDAITEGWREPRKTIFEMVYVQGLSTKQCAERLGVTVQAVSRHRRIIERELREELSDDPDQCKRHQPR